MARTYIKDKQSTLWNALMYGIQDRTAMLDSHASERRFDFDWGEMNVEILGEEIAGFFINDLEIIVDMERMFLNLGLEGRDGCLAQTEKMLKTARESLNACTPDELAGFAQQDA